MNTNINSTCISIIVPLYNSEKYASRCIDSLLNQTLKDFELILVNDGSTDSTGEICNKYAKNDSRIKVIHQENSGVSAARNTGISASSGKYIGFVDADDTVASDMFNKLLCDATQNSADIVMCDALTVYSDGKYDKDTIKQLTESCMLTHNDIKPQLLSELAGAVWRCIYSSGLIKSNNITFPIGIKLSEDRIFNIMSMGLAKRISYIKEPYYNRYINADSAVHRFHADYFESCKRAEDACTRAIEIAWDNNEAYHRAYMKQFVSGALSALCNYYYKTSTLTSKERREAVKSVCDNSRLQNAIRTVGAGRIGDWIINKNYNMIIMYAKLANLKHRR